MTEYIDVYFDEPTIGLSNDKLIAMLVEQFDYAKELDIKVYAIMRNGTVEFMVDGDDELVERLVEDLE